MTGNYTGDGSQARRWAMAWQERALTYLDLVPELGHSARFYGKMLSQLRIYPGFRNDQGKIDPITSGEPVELLDRIQDPGGGRAQIQKAYGRLMFTTGEGYLFGRDLETVDERWSFVWNTELMIDGPQITWYQFPGAAAKMFTNVASDESGGVGPLAVAYRMWTPHPRSSGEADSPMRSVTEGGIAEELITLTKAVEATAMSRITNGILAVPQELSPGAIDGGRDEDPENDPFIADFIDHVTAAIEEPGAPAARVPFTIWGGYDYLDRVRWIATHDPQTDYMEKDLRKEAVERIAHGLDMPPEWLMGMGGANHWSARQIISDMWPSHGASVGQQWVDDLNLVYLRPALREAGYGRWDEVVIGMDPSEITVDPDRSRDADEAFDRGAISRAAYRAAKKFKETDAAPEEEHDEWLAIKLRDPGLLEGGDPLAGGERGPVPEPGTRDPDASDGPPSPGPNGVSRQDRLAAQVLGAAELAVVRCHEVAGARIRTKQHSCPDCLSATNGQPNALVASVLGADTLNDLNLDPAKLVRDGSGTFRVLLRSWGVDDVRADMLCTLVEQHAARTLVTAAVGLPDEFVKAVSNGALQR